MTDELRPPARILGNRYRLGAVIARGGMAEVWTAHDLTLDRRVAVKILHPGLTADDASIERFRREARATAQMAHPNIVSVYDTGEDDGTVYLVMEYVEGDTLRRLLDSQGPLPVERAIELTAQIADALDESHRRGFVHRDVKPANVLIDGAGRAKVTDFGIAKLVGDSGDLTRTGVVVGTARYLSPEQLRGDDTDHRTDVYSLALLTYEMLAGRAAFGGDTDISSAVSRMTSDPEPLTVARPDLDPAVAQAVERGLARERDDRWESAAAFRDALRGRAATAPPRRVGSTTSTAVAGATRRVRSVEQPSPQSPPHTGSVEAIPVDAEPLDAVPVDADREADRTGTSAITVPAHRRRARGRWWILFILLALVSTAAGVAAWQLVGDDDSDSGTLPIVGASDFDPPPGDGREHPDRTGLAVDGDPATGWTTETYSDPGFGPKDGVGLRIDLDGTYDISWVRVETDLAGWSAAIYVGENPGDDLASWNGPFVSASELETAVRFRLDPPVRGSSVLLWITGLPDGGRLVVEEVQIG